MNDEIVDILGRVPKFPLGKLVATTNATDQIPGHEITDGLLRHIDCDWGDVDPEKRVRNNVALMEGSRLLSVYQTEDGEKFWIITEADRSATTILLPEDYPL